MKPILASILPLLGGASVAHAVARVEPALPVPEADTYLLLALGIGLVMFLARRR